MTDSPKDRPVEHQGIVIEAGETQYGVHEGE